MKRLLITVGVAAVAAAAAAVATKILESHRQIPDDELPPVPPEEASSGPLTPAQHLKAAAAGAAAKILESHRQIPDDELPPVPPEETPSGPLTPAQHLKAAAAGVAAKILESHRQIPDDEEPPIPMTAPFQEEPAAAQEPSQRESGCCDSPQEVPLSEEETLSSPPAPEKPLA